YAVIERTNLSTNIVRLEWAAVDPETLGFRASGVGNDIAVIQQRGGRIEARRPLCQSKRYVARTGIQGLFAQHGKVLRDGMPKNRTEYADVVTSPITDAHDGF